MRPFQHRELEEVSAERIFHALSEPVRVEIVRRLAIDGEASCGALDRGRPKSSMSHHFRVLRAAGLVHSRAEGTTHINRLRREELELRFPGLLNALLRATAPVERT